MKQPLRNGSKMLLIAQKRRGFFHQHPRSRDITRYQPKIITWTCAILTKPPTTISFMCSLRKNRNTLREKILTSSISTKVD